MLVVPALHSITTLKSKVSSYFVFYFIEKEKKGTIGIA
jgi:hypothetical protein